MGENLYRFSEANQWAGIISPLQVAQVARGPLKGAISRRHAACGWRSLGRAPGAPASTAPPIGSFESQASNHAGEVGPRFYAVPGAGSDPLAATTPAEKGRASSKA